MAYYEVWIKYKSTLSDKIIAYDEEQAIKRMLSDYGIKPENVISTEINEISEEAYYDPEY